MDKLRIVKHFCDHCDKIVKRPLFILNLFRGYFRTLILHKQLLRIVEFSITYTCNSNCKFCYATKFQKKDQEILSLHEIKDVWWQAKKLGAIAAIVTGGEPTTRPDFFEVIKILEPKKHLITLNTNAIKFDEQMAKELASLGLAVVAFSLDGDSPETNDPIRNHEGHFQKVMQGIELCKKYRIKPTICPTITKDRLYMMEKMAALAKTLETDMVIAPASTFGNLAGDFEKRLSKNDWNYVMDVFDRHPHLRGDWTLNYSMRVECPGGREKINISPYGEITACTLNQLSFGSVRQESLQEIWNRIRNFEFYKKRSKICLIGFDEEYQEKVIDPISNSEINPVSIFEHPNYKHIYKNDKQQCPFCSSRNISILLKDAEDLEYHDPGKWDICFCQHCLVAFVYPRLSLQEVLDNYYPQEYVQYHPRKGKITQLLYRSYIQNIAKKVQSLIGNKGKILEVGCGCGESIAILSELGEWDIIGLEPIDHAIESGKKLGVDIRKGTLKSFSKETNEKFDVIIMLHVIEHIPDPQRDLEYVFKLLKPGGYLIGETENILSWDFKIFGRYWGMLHLPRHLYFFSARSLTDVMKKARFESTNINYSPNTSGWALGLQFLIQKKLLKQQTTRRAPYYPILLFLCIPIALIQKMFKSTGIMGFCGQKPHHAT